MSAAELERRARAEAIVDRWRASAEAFVAEIREERDATATRTAPTPNPRSTR